MLLVSTRRAQRSGQPPAAAGVRPLNIFSCSSVSRYGLHPGRQKAVMSSTLLNRNCSYHRTSDSDLAACLRKVLDAKYGSILGTARRQWERSFRGADPSDRCVSVRVSGASTRPLAVPARYYLKA